MQLTATIDRATLSELLREVTPLRVKLGSATQDRFFTIEPPSLIEFLPARGVRLRTQAHVQWSVAGVAIPLTLESATFVLIPSLAPAPEAGKLVFELKLEQLDLKNVPKMIESTLVPLINDGLAALDKPLGWDFAKTLTHRFAISPKAAPLAAFTLATGRSSLEVTADAIVLSLALEMHFETTNPAPAAANRPATSSS